MKYMEQKERTELLKDLEQTMQEIVKASGGKPEEYDRMTQEVSNVIGQIKGWSTLQIRLFEIYFKLSKDQL